MLSWPIIRGYLLVIKFCKKLRAGEDTKYLENMIMLRSNLLKIIEKITTFSLLTVYMYELERFLYAIIASYITLFLIYFAVSSQQLSYIFAGASVVIFITLILKYLAVLEFGKCRF